VPATLGEDCPGNDRNEWWPPLDQRSTAGP